MHSTCFPACNTLYSSRPRRPRELGDWKCSTPEWHLANRSVSADRHEYMDTWMTRNKMNRLSIAMYILVVRADMKVSRKKLKLKCFSIELTVCDIYRIWFKSVKKINRFLGTISSVGADAACALKKVPGKSLFPVTLIRLSGRRQRLRCFLGLSIATTTK